MPLLALVLTCLPTFATPQLQPRTYASPSGRWELRVEPSTRGGTGAADYTLTGAGSAAWTRRHPFALWDAAVTDDGRVAGYAYVGSTPDAPHGGSLHVVLLSPAGELLLDEAHERVSSGFMHQPGTPTARGLFLQPELGRFVVRFDDPDLNRGAEEWRAHDLVFGTALFQERPKLTLEGLEHVHLMLGARPVPGTPLVLVHWYRFASEVKPWSLGGVFQLLDVPAEGERRAVWRLDLPHDYEVSGDRGAQDRLREEIWKESAILAVGPRRFELRHAAEALRVAYELEASAEGSWQVREVAREPYAPPVPTPTLGPPLRPELRREVALAGAAPTPAEIRDVMAFGFDEAGRLRFARWDGGETTLVRLSETGEVLHTKTVRIDLGPEDHLLWTPLAGTSWLAVAFGYDEGSRTHAWRVAESTGEPVELPEFPGRAVDRVVELADGRLLVLSQQVHVYTRTGARPVSAPWHTERDPEDPSVRSTEDIAVTSTGEVVTLDVVRKALRVFSAAGRHLRTIDLPEAWGAEPRYPTALVADRSGGVLVHDYRGKDALVRMGLDGTVLARLDARMADGQPRAEYRRNLRFAPDGRMWTTDGHVLVRLDAEGRAELELGAPSRPEWLEAPGPAAVDSGFGRLLVLDQRTRALHVFDAEGRRVLLGVPRSTDLEALRWPLRMGCDPAGGAWTAQSAYEKHILRFGPDGARLGPTKIEVRNPVFFPGRTGYWGIADSKPLCVGPDGKLLQAIPKLPDGRWWRWIEDLSVAADGSLAVLDLPRSDGIQREPGSGLLARFDAEGRPLGLHDLPPGTFPKLVAHAGRWVLASHYGLPAWLLDTREGSWHEVNLEASAEGEVALGLSPDGDELWVLEAQRRRLKRYALP